MSLREPSQDFSASQSHENSACKRPASEQRIQANQTNALRSTGPKTLRGKRTVARNAIKHGLLAREVVIAGGDGEENLKDFHALVARLLEHYEPVDVIEESLVETIAICWWRKARVIRAENGEIRKRLDTIAVDRAQRKSNKGNLALLLSEAASFLYRAENPADAKVSTRDRWSAMQAIQSNMREHCSGLAHLSALLEKAKSEIANHGYISENIRNEIFLGFCFWDYLFALTCFGAGPQKPRWKNHRQGRL